MLENRLAYEEDIRAYNKGLNEGRDSNKSKFMVNDDYDDEERMSEVVAMVKEEALKWEEIISFIINLHIVLGVD
ncbi:hypothetical protein AHAS_Ahas20G0109100 [Arachis hypogaea]